MHEGWWQAASHILALCRPLLNVVVSNKNSSHGCCLPMRWELRDHIAHELLYQMRQRSGEMGAHRPVGREADCLVEVQRQRLSSVEDLHPQARCSQRTESQSGVKLVCMKWMTISGNKF
jgi:hypothetical protein